MALAIEMLDLAPTVAVSNEVGGIVLAQYRQGLIELALFDVAMSCEVATGGASRDEIFAG
jgi:hypothetical protein